MHAFHRGRIWPRFTFFMTQIHLFQCLYWSYIDAIVHFTVVYVLHCTRIEVYVTNTRHYRRDS